MTTFALERLEEFDDDEDAELRVRAFTKNGRNDFATFCKKTRKAGMGSDIDTLLRCIEDLRLGKKLPPKQFKPLGTRAKTKSRVHEGEHEFVIRKLRIYCVIEDGCIIVLLDGHIKKGKGGDNTDQIAMINSIRDTLRNLEGPLGNLPDLEH